LAEHDCLDLKAVATWEVDGTGMTTGVPHSMYLLSGSILNGSYRIICILVPKSVVNLKSNMSS
jgi:hypothetical protein